MSKMEQLLKSAGFKLNSYPEGNFLIGWKKPGEVIQLESIR